ncbi:MAG TPA: hypothetical protein VLK30_09035 [Candidatus Limnocylindrales bacterium]|nr:hypothetical protein [Candidatus Limnocylindrales bacterium]
MARWLVAGACAIAVMACGSSGPSTAASTPKPQPAQSIAQNSADFPDLLKCAESGSYDSYLLAEQSKSPDQYKTDKKTWDDLKAAGANDSFIAAYADSNTDCNQFASSNLSGKVSYVFAIRFKDKTSAAASYTTQQAQFHLTDSDVANLKALGGKVVQGSDTGLGANSTTVSFSVAGAGVSLYIALWQTKAFEVAVLVYNLSPASGSAAATKINGRVR